MPRDWKDEVGTRQVPRRTWLKMPVIGMESEFNVWLDEVEIDPKKFWKHPSAFIDRELLPREKSSLQLPTGGAVYFDRGVIEVVTPVIELGPHSTARMVRNLWEQIAFVRDQLTKWERRSGHTVRLKAYSAHYNISFEIPKSQQSANRNEKKLALLLAYLLPIPVMIVAANRRSTGIGVRPRGGRIEVTCDFTPDPGLMVASATLIVGIVREVMSWPTYDLSLLQKLRIPVVAGVVPGKHTTRKGWLTKDFHYPQSPYTSDINAPIWMTQFGQKLSVRQIGKRVAWYFRRSIRMYSDPFSFRLLFAILDGRAPSMLELVDRPTAYEDVGHLCKWGMVIHELKNYHSELALMKPKRITWESQSIDDYILERQKARAFQSRELQTVNMKEPKAIALMPKRRRPRLRRRSDAAGRLVPPRTSEYMERRGMSLLPTALPKERRRRADRRRRNYAVPFPDRRLTRSAYEQVFLKLVSGGRLRIGTEMYRPVGMKGWYHAVFRRDSDGTERLLSIDQLLEKMNDWS